MMTRSSFVATIVTQMESAMKNRIAVAVFALSVSLGAATSAHAVPVLPAAPLVVAGFVVTAANSCDTIYQEEAARIDWWEFIGDISGQQADAMREDNGFQWSACQNAK